LQKFNLNFLSNFFSWVPILDYNLKVEIRRMHTLESAPITKTTLFALDVRGLTSTQILLYTNHFPFILWCTFILMPQQRQIEIPCSLFKKVISKHYNRSKKSWTHNALCFKFHNLTRSCVSCHPTTLEQADGKMARFKKHFFCLSNV
jgi:hypothetical protein